eukprot:1951224-Prymnesium_polylepis.1
MQSVQSVQPCNQCNQCNPVLVVLLLHLRCRARSLDDCWVSMDDYGMIMLLHLRCRVRRAACQGASKRQPHARHGRGRGFERQPRRVGGRVSSGVCSGVRRGKQRRVQRRVPRSAAGRVRLQRGLCGYSAAWR